MVQRPVGRMFALYGEFKAILLAWCHGIEGCLTVNQLADNHCQDYIGIIINMASVYDILYDSHTLPFD
jgi:hypothetical protein